MRKKIRTNRLAQFFGALLFLLGGAGELHAQGNASGQVRTYRDLAGDDQVQELQGVSLDQAWDAAVDFLTPEIPTGDELLETLRDRAMGAIAGCEYQEYLTLISRLGEGWERALGIVDRDTGRRWSVPMIDPLATILKGAGSATTLITTEAERTNLAFALESVCSSVRTADEINRKFHIFENGTLYVGRAINLLLTPGEDLGRVNAAKRRELIASFGDLYEAVPKSESSDVEAVWTASNEALEENLRIADELTETLDNLEVEIMEAREDLLVFATIVNEGGSTRFSCPPQFPDPNRRDVETYPTVRRGEKRVCGPVSPGRADQVTARLGVLVQRLQQIQISADSRVTSAEGVQLLVKEHQRRSLGEAQSASLISGF